MNVSAATHFFSIRTGSAVEIIVKNKVLHKDALTSAYFIRIFNEWFSLLSRKVRKTSTTKNNKETNMKIFLENVINLVEETEFGKGWKPLNTGIIMTTVSFIDICETLFLNFNYEFVLGHRFTQMPLKIYFPIFV